MVDLKNIYAKQLPNMPKEYIVRLVFDRGHRSLIALKARLHATTTHAVRDNGTRARTVSTCSAAQPAVRLRLSHGACW
jgi:hypothetical protein